MYNVYHYYFSCRSTSVYDLNYTLKFPTTSILTEGDNDYYNYNQATVQLYTNEIDRDTIRNRTVVMNTLVTEQQEDKEQSSKEQLNDNDEDKLNLIDKENNVDDEEIGEKEKNSEKE
ncbi:hypothetical protein KGR20_24490 [Cytobacillus oceanisediminis]|uniref:hypothetical protein n=1 Tax=Cytobacillus oceanisediminis TaxID=665099 RepID=UPI001CCC1488|nr:hypothetical protein [Cytobacillus oceanisediminis]MBZ9537287.1 hypothetical protein [Cytobacillus oceanisediminis]